MAFVAALVLGLLALAIAPGYTFYFDVTPKTLALLVGAAGLLVLAARRAESPRGPRLFAALLLLNTASLAVSTVFSINCPLSLYGGTWRCFGALMQAAVMLFAWLVAWQSAGRPDHARIILRGVSIAGVLAGWWGVTHAAGTLGDAGNLAVWLLLSGFLSLALSNMETQRMWRVASRVAAAAVLVALAVIAPRAPAYTLLWRDTLSMASHRPLAGYGPEVFVAEFPHFESRALTQSSPDAIYESPRNAFLDTLAAQGVPGVLLLCALCLAGITAAWKRRAGWLTAALAAGIIGLQFTCFTVPTAALFLTTIGLTMALSEEPTAPRPSPIFSAVAPILVLALLYFALRITVADHELVVTRRLLDARELPAASAQYDAYAYWSLPGASADIWYSRSWMEVARTATNPGVRSQALVIAGQAAQRGVANAEEPFLAWYTSAQISALQGHIDDAQNSLRWAIAAYPNWYLPHWMLSQYLRESHAGESRKEAALAAELAPSLHLH